MEKTFQNVPRCSYNTPIVFNALEKKMDLRIFPFTLIICLILLPTAPLIRAQQVLPEPWKGPMTPELFEEIKNMAIARAEDMQGFFIEDEYPPDIANSLRNAEQAMEQAENFEDINIHSAAQQYIRSMNHYRNAIRKLYGENPEISEQFTEPEVTTAGNETEPASMEEIEATKIELINQFQERFKLQIQQMIQNIEDFEDEMSPQDFEKANAALQRTMEKLLRIQERIQSGQYEEALDELDEADESLDEELDQVEDPGTAQMLKTMNQLEARIQKMVMRAARKAANGEDTSTEDAQLEDLRGNKDKLKNDYKENRGKSGQNGNQGGQGQGNN
jgi:hypothetical protein